MESNDMLNILVVDDEPSVCELLGSLLKSSSRQVSVRDNPAEAIDFVQRNRVDVALVDLMMPGMNGFELTSHIRKKHPEVHVVICTGEMADQYLEKARQVHVDRVLQKPFNLGQVIRIVEAFRRP